MSTERVAELEAQVEKLRKLNRLAGKKLIRAAKWITASVTHMEAIVKENQKLKAVQFDADLKKSLVEGEQQTALLREIRDLLKAGAK